MTDITIPREALDKDELTGEIQEALKHLETQHGDSIYNIYECASALAEILLRLVKDKEPSNG